MKLIDKMKNLDDKKQFYIVSVMISAFLLLYQQFITEDFFHVRVIGFFTILTVGYIFYHQRKMIGTFINLATLFITAIVLFSNGEVILSTFGVPYKELTAFMYDRFTAQEISRAAIYNIISLLALSAGFCLSYKKKEKLDFEISDLKEKSEAKVSELALKITGLGLTMISVPFDLYDKIQIVRESMDLGYAEFNPNAYEANSIVLSLSLFAIVGCFILAAGLKNNKILRWFPILYLLMRCAMFLFSGSRGEAIGLIVGLVWFVFTIFDKKKPDEKDKKKKIVILGIIGYLLLVLMSAVVTYRGVDEKTFIDFMGVFLKEFVSLSVVKDVINEMGFSIRPLMEAMRFDKSGIINHSYGMTYVFSLIMIVPSFLRFGIYDVGLKLGYVELENMITQYVGTNYGIGYSIQTESFYNFCGIGWLVLVPIGYILGKLILSSNLCRENERSIKAALNATLFALLVFTARASTLLLFKYIIYYYMIPLLGFTIIKALLKTEFCQRIVNRKIESRQETGVE